MAKTDNVFSIYGFGKVDIVYNGKSIMPPNINDRIINMLLYGLLHKNILLDADTLLKAVFTNENELKEQSKQLNVLFNQTQKLLAFENMLKMDFNEFLSLTSCNGSYKWIVSNDVEIDWEKFLDIVQRIENEKDLNALMLNFQSMTQYYGEGLPINTDSPPWLKAACENFRQSFIQSVNTILLRHSEFQKDLDIVEICQQAAEICDIDETFNCFYINALTNTGQEGSAIKRYNYVVGRMKKDFSLEPSEKLMKLYERIKSDWDRDELMVEAEKMAEDKMRNMMEEMFNNYFISKTLKYSIAQIHVACENPNQNYDHEEITKNLQSALQYVLRKNDMYVVFDSNTAIAVLCDAREEYFSNICNRIRNTFFSNNDKKLDFSLKIEIKPIVNVIY